MRTTSLLLVLLLAASSRGDEQPKLTPINLDTAKTGVVGRLGLTDKDAGQVVVHEVIDEKSFVAKVVYVRGADAFFVVKVPTKDFADGQVRKELLGQIWKVTGTQKRSGKTMFVLEPVEKK